MFRLNLVREHNDTRKYKPYSWTFCCQQYNLDITDGNQVLLISHVKRMGPAGAPPPGPAMLIPELCYLTGYCLILQCVTLNSD